MTSVAGAAALAEPRLARRSVARALPVAALGLLPAAVAATNGGYFATTWGWTSLVLAWAAAVALAVGAETRPTRLELAAVATFAALACWYALSALWSGAPNASILEGERALVYPLALLAAFLLVRRRDVVVLLGAICAGTTVVSLYALATRLYPDRLGTLDAVAGRRLSAPLGYWNALGTFAALGVLLALGLAARARTRAARALAAAALVVLLPTLFFTFSRGAWLALLVGCAVVLALDARRTQLVTASLAALAAPTAAVLLCARSRALTHEDALPALAAREGHRLAPLLVLLAALSALAAIALDAAHRRVRPTANIRRAYAGMLVAAAVASVAFATASHGGPTAVAVRAYRSFSAPPPRTGGDLTKRLFSFSGDGRSIQFRVAWHEAERHPLLGGGGGTYERTWLHDRPSGDWKIRNVHNGYLEALAEVGPVGLGLLVAALALPLLALGRARRHPLAAVAAGAYAAALAHAAVDWDWEMTGLTLTALGCAAALLRMRPGDEDVGGIGARRRVAAIAVVVAAAAVAAGALLGNLATARAARDVRAERWAPAAAAARTAERWAPWSAEPVKWLGEAQVGAGDLVAARATLRRAIAKDEGDWELWFDLALAEPHASAAQADALRRAVALDPLSREVREFAAGAGLKIPTTEQR